MSRKPLSTRIDHDLQKEIKKLAIDLEIPLNDLFEEALQDILNKYGRVAALAHPSSNKTKVRRTRREKSFVLADE